MIGLLLPFWLNLDGGGPPAPVHHDAPGSRLMSVPRDDRTIAVEPDSRALPVAADDRTIPVTDDEVTMILKKKDSGDTLDYTRDFGAFLASAEGIADASWELSGADASLEIGETSYAPTVSSDGKRCTVWLSGGNTGVTYTVKVTATTNNSPARVVERSFQLEIQKQ